MSLQQNMMELGLNLLDMMKTDISGVKSNLQAIKDNMNAQMQTMNSISQLLQVITSRLAPSATVSTAPASTYTILEDPSTPHAHCSSSIATSNASTLT